MTTLITGATGFVGSAVARTFAARGPCAAAADPCQPATGGTSRPGCRDRDRRPDRPASLARQPRAAAMSCMSRPIIGCGCPTRGHAAGQRRRRGGDAARRRRCRRRTHRPLQLGRRTGSDRRRHAGRRGQRRPTKRISSASTSAPNTLRNVRCWNWRGATAAGRGGQPGGPGRATRHQADTNRQDDPGRRRRSVPAYIDTGLNIVHVDDVAEGHALALEKGTIGERYVLGGEHGAEGYPAPGLRRRAGGRPPSACPKLSCGRPPLSWKNSRPSPGSRP